MTDDLQRWHDRWRTALAVFADPTGFVERPPPGGDPEARLAVLLELWKALGVPSQVVWPMEDAASRWSERAAGVSTREGLRDKFREVLPALELAIARSLDGGAQAPELVRTADFGKAGCRFIPLSDPQQNVAVVVGVVEVLPVDHRLRTLLPAADLFMFANHSPALVLGLAHANGTARQFYTTVDVAQLTKLYRSQQIRKQAETDEQERLEKLRQQRQFADSELGRHMARERELERLAKQGRLPADLPPAEPAVRGAGRISDLPARRE